MTKEEQATALVEKIIGSASGFFNVFSIYLGHKLGLYRVLAGGPIISSRLAEATGTHERYVREWLEQQAVAGILEVGAKDGDGQTRAYSLPEGHAEVLVEEDSLNYLSPFVQLLVGAVSPLPRLLDVYRNGGGIPYGDYGQDVLEGQGGVNRAPLLQLLGGEWLPAVTEVHARLQATPPARVVDFGCGAGWSSIGLAKAYPNVQVHGLDLDAQSIAAAEKNAEDHGVADRVKFEVRDAGDPALAGQYDLVLAVECVHDMSNPIAALKVMRQLAGKGGTVIVIDERVGEQFDPPGSELEWMMYGWSILHCLPAGMADTPSAGTGTVLRPAKLAEYAEAAGFARTEELPVFADFFRFYRLHP
ncbi:MAG: class I SAM-dependent methyltransferase [Dehalococcoidia bacterium]